MASRVVQSGPALSVQALAPEQEALPRLCAAGLGQQSGLGQLLLWGLEPLLLVLEQQCVSVGAVMAVAERMCVLAPVRALVQGKPLWPAMGLGPLREPP